jgi:hypothetical protein
MCRDGHGRFRNIKYIRHTFPQFIKISVLQPFIIKESADPRHLY